MESASMHHAQLFALRLWTEPGDTASCGVRFKVEHVLSGKARYTRNWSEVEAFVMQTFHDGAIGVRPKKET